jgi:hypothetical protein
MDSWYFSMSGATIFCPLSKGHLAQRMQFVSMFIMVVLDSKFNQDQHQKILEFFKGAGIKKRNGCIIEFY